MVLQDAALTVRNLIYTNYAGANPSKADLGATGVVRAPRDKKDFTHDAISVYERRDDSADKAIGPTPPALHYLSVIVCVWSKDQDHVFSMRQEVERIVRAFKANPGGDYGQIDFLGGSPRRDLRPSDSLFAFECVTRLQVWVGS